MMNYFGQNKRKMFPEIKDFSDPQDKLRNTPGYKLKFGDWFWFNPWAYRYFMVGIPLLFAIVFGVLSIVAFVKAWVITAALFILMTIICIPQVVKKWQKLPEWKKSKMNMYDQYIREYRPENE
jgi:hypothetical protein